MDFPVHAATCATRTGLLRPKAFGDGWRFSLVVDCQNATLLIIDDYNYNKWRGEGALEFRICR